MLQAAFAQGAEAAIVSSRVILIISLLHFLIIFLAVLVSYPWETLPATFCFMWRLPSSLYQAFCSISSAFLFQYSDEPHGFRTDSQHQRRCHGESHRLRGHQPENDYINPVIRIAVASHSMLFLLPRPKCNVFEKDKIDLLMEGYLIYGETLEQGAHRILRQTLPTAPLDHLHFNFMYHLRMKPPTAWSISSH